MMSKNKTYPILKQERIDSARLSERGKDGDAKL